jgi:hypothetical protein
VAGKQPGVAVLLESAIAVVAHLRLKVRAEPGAMHRAVDEAEIATGVASFSSFRRWCEVCSCDLQTSNIIEIDPQVQDPWGFQPAVEREMLTGILAARLLKVGAQDQRVTLHPQDRTFLEVR